MYTHTHTHTRTRNQFRARMSTASPKELRWGSEFWVRVIPQAICGVYTGMRLHNSVHTSVLIRVVIHGSCVHYPPPYTHTHTRSSILLGLTLPPAQQLFHFWFDNQYETLLFHTYSMYIILYLVLTQHTHILTHSDKVKHWRKPMQISCRCLTF